MTPQANKNKQLPLRTLTSSRTISHCYPIFFLMPEERERKESKNERKN
jgi:hypothetical protein